MSKNYYFHPAYRAYLDALEIFARQCGGISRELALLFELNATKDNRGNIHPEQISEEWQRVFYDPDYYGGSIHKLEKSIQKKKDGYHYRDRWTGQVIEVIGTRKAWRTLCSAAQAAGIKVIIDEGDSPEAWEQSRFYKMMTSLEAVCDLRAQLYRWIRSDRAKMAKGQATITPDPSLVADKDWRPIEMLSIERIFAKYDKLLVSRKKKAGK